MSTHDSSPLVPFIVGIAGVLLVMILIVKTFGTSVHDHHHHHHHFNPDATVNFGDDIEPPPDDTPSEGERASQAHQETLITSRKVTQQAYKALDDVELLEIILFNLLPTAEVDWAEIERTPFEKRVIKDALMTPRGHTHAGNIESKPRDVRLKTQFGTLRHDNSSYIRLVADRLPPRDCPISQAHDNVWDLCALEDLNKLVRVRLGKPLYISEARLDPKALQIIVNRFLALSPDTPLYDDRRTLAEVYQQLSAAAPEYIQAREALTRHGDKKALEAYRRALKRHPDDMISFYETFTRKRLELDSFIAPDLVGFWLRRMNDGTDSIILEAIKGAEARFAQDINP